MKQSKRLIDCLQGSRVELSKVQKHLIITALRRYKATNSSMDIVAEVNSIIRLLKEPEDISAQPVVTLTYKQVVDGNANDGSIWYSKTDCKTYTRYYLRMNPGQFKCHTFVKIENI